MAITSPNHSYNFQTSALRTICRILPGAFLWLIIVTLFFLAFYDARSYFIFTAPFFIFNAFLLAHVGVFSIKGIRDMLEAAKKDYHKEYLEKRRLLEQTLGSQQLQQTRRNNRDNEQPTIDAADQNNENDTDEEKMIFNFEDIIHYVIIPNYKEDPDTLSETMSSMADSAISKQIIIVLAMEEREQGGAEKAANLKQKFAANFKDIISSYHPPGLEGEQAGKSSNEAWAAAEIAKHVDQCKFNQKHVLISTCDADSIFHPKHYDYITMQYCLDYKKRHTSIWQGPMINYKNYDSIPAATKMLCTAVSLHEIACLADPMDHHIPFSSYTMSYELASVAGGWDGDVIPEDWHMYMKCFFATAGKANVEAIPLPVQCYAVEDDKSYWQSMVDRYVQAKRHAWGVSELSFFIYKIYECLFKMPSSKRPSLIRLIGLGYKAFSLHYFGALGVIVIVLTGIVTQLYRFVPYYANNTAVADAVANTWSIVFKVHNIFTAIPLILIIYANYRLVKIVISPQYGRWYHVIQWILHWLLLAPVVNFVFATYPEIWAFTRFMFTDQLVYITASKGKSAPSTAVTPANEFEGNAEDAVTDQNEFEIEIEGGSDDLQPMSSAASTSSDDAKHKFGLHDDDDSDSTSLLKKQ